MSRRLLFLILVSGCAICCNTIGDTFPPGVRNLIGSDGKITHAMMFTTKAYQNEALKLVIREANKVAKELKLPEELPITESNIVKVFVNPFGYAYVKKAVGNVTTKHFVYYVSQGNKFSYLESPNQDELCRKFQASSTLPVGRINTNEAFILASKWLKAVSMDVEALNRDCAVKVELDNAYVHPPAGKFVPVYFVSWSEKNGGAGCVASVRLFSPTKTLLQLRVENPKYITRPPIVFTNLAFLLSQSNISASIKRSTIK